VSAEMRVRVAVRAYTEGVESFRAAACLNAAIALSEGPTHQRPFHGRRPPAVV